MGAIKGLRVVLAVLLCLVLGGSLWLTVQRQVFHQEELAVGGLILAPVEGDAMAPALEQGSLAVAVPREDYQLGDVVLYDAGFTRLVGSVEGDFIARGDAQGEEAEALLPTADIQGAVIAALPGGGEVWGFLSSLWGPPVVLVVGVLLLALPSLFGLGREPAGAPAQEQPGNALFGLMRMQAAISFPAPMKRDSDTKIFTMCV